MVCIISICFHSFIEARSLLPQNRLITKQMLKNYITCSRKATPYDFIQIIQQFHSTCFIINPFQFTSIYCHILFQHTYLLFHLNNIHSHIHNLISLHITCHTYHLSNHIYTYVFHSPHHCFLTVFIFECILIYYSYHTILMHDCILIFVSFHIIIFHIVFTFIFTNSCTNVFSFS